MAMHISRVTLVVSDYDAALAFYVEKLGFACLEDTRLSETKRWVVVVPKGTETGLLLAKADGEQQERAIGNQAGGRVAFFLQTNDFESDYARMQGAGVTFLEAPRYESYGTVAVFEDPFGNKWDLIQSKK